MSYKALYRVYRPSTFDDIQGQEHIRVTLMNIIKNDKLSHAYLFSGPRGTGKTSIARIFAKTINCTVRENDVNPCDKCSSCLASNENRTLDIIEMDAASNNGVAEVREIRENIKFFPSESQHKIYIIDEVHMLSTGAFNALLKILEEPPDHAVFILATTEPSKIPSTILSRVQRFNFRQIENNVISMHLKNIFAKENIKYEPEAIDIIVSLSNGSLRDALSISDQTAAYTNSNIKCDDLWRIFGIISIDKKIELINLIYEKNLKNSLKLLNNMIADGINIKKLVESLIDIIKDYIVYNTTNKKSLLVILSAEHLSYMKLDSNHAYMYIETLINLLNQLHNADVPEQNITLAILKMVKFNDKVKISSRHSLSNESLNNTDEFSTKELSLINVELKEEEQAAVQDVLMQVPENKEETKLDDLESILDDFNLEKTKSNFNVSEDVEKIEEMVEEEKKQEVYSFSDQEILNLLVQFKPKYIEVIKEKSKELVHYLGEESMKKYVEWLTSPSLKLLSAGEEFILFATTDFELRNDINKKRRQKGFVKTIKEVFGEDYSVYVLLLDQWYKIKDKYMELRKSGELPKASNIIRKIEATDEEIYGTELFGKIFNSK